MEAVLVSVSFSEGGGGALEFSPPPSLVTSSPPKILINIHTFVHVRMLKPTYRYDKLKLTHRHEPEFIDFLNAILDISKSHAKQ